MLGASSEKTARPRLSKTPNASLAGEHGASRWARVGGRLRRVHLALDNVEDRDVAAPVLTGREGAAWCSRGEEPSATPAAKDEGRFELGEREETATAFKRGEACRGALTKSCVCVLESSQWTSETRAVSWIRENTGRAKVSSEGAAFDGDKVMN
eukprot:2271563-Pleurochrysis_carterae.AAC.2